jgi:hypothetical protein
MKSNILCFLPICVKPTNKHSEIGELRIEQYINGLNKFFEFNKNNFNIDVVIFDNTVSTITDIPDTITSIYRKT